MKGLTLKAFSAAVQRYWSTYLVVAGLIFALGMTAILLLPARYVSSSRLLVSVEGSTTAAAYQNEEVATRRIRSYIPLLTSGVMTQRVIDKLGLPMSSAELADKITATNVPPKTALIDIEVIDESPERAQLLADTVAAEFVAYSDAIETPTGEDNQKIHTTVVSTASAGREDLFDRALLDLLAAVTALLIGAVAVWIRASREPERPHTAPIESGDHARHRARETVEAADRN